MDMDGHRSSGTGTGVCEIEEVDENSNERQLHDDDDDDDEEEYCVYVAVGKSDTSMDALSWALNNFVAQSPSTIIYLIHVFPQINHIPNPLGIGMIPRNQVSAEQVESYIDQERGKRRELLQKFLQSCSTSKVKVDTILIESDSVAKAILDLIPILQIKRLVIGANKLHLRKSKSRRGKGIADQILQNAPQSCKVRIICEKKEVNEQMMSLSPFPQPLATCTSANDASITSKKEDHQNDLVSCICFIPKFK
ncbi:U-box domain-containing protein 35 [Glycine soja]